MTPKEFAAAKHRWLDEVESDKSVGHLAFRLAYIIAGYLNTKTGDAWPSQTILAGRLGVTTRSVQTALDELVGFGHLAVEIQHGPGNTNRYRPVDENANHTSPFQPVETTKSRSAAQPMTKSTAPNDEKSFVQNSLYEPSLRTFSIGDVKIDSAFEEWFQHYPRQTSKEAARNAYREVIAQGKATPEQLLSAATAYKVHVEADPLGPEPAEPRLWLQRGKYLKQPQPPCG
jgi:DNA-binding transcriptional MocR family regulator